MKSHQRRTVRHLHYNMTEKFVPPTPETIAQRLQEQGKNEVKQEINTEQTVPFDISRLSKDQLQALKMALNATPDTPTKKRDGITIQLRKTAEGETIVWFGTVYKRYIQNPETLGQINTEMIKYKVYGNDEAKEMKYEEFMLLEKDTFKVVDIDIQDNVKVVGEVVARETGQLMDAVVNNSLRSYTVEINGEKVVITQDNVN